MFLNSNELNKYGTALQKWMSILYIHQIQTQVQSGASYLPTAGGASGGIKIAKDAITYCTSGLVDRNITQYCSLLVYTRQSKP